MHKEENVIPWSMRFSLWFRLIGCFFSIVLFLLPESVYLQQPDITWPNLLFVSVLGIGLSLFLLIFGTETVECLDNELILSRFLIKPKRIQWAKITEVKSRKIISASQYGIWITNVFAFKCDDGKRFNLFSGYYSKTDIAVFVSLLRDKAINADINLE